MSQSSRREGERNITRSSGQQERFNLDVQLRIDWSADNITYTTTTTTTSMSKKETEVLSKLRLSSFYLYLGLDTEENAATTQTLKYGYNLK